jgi:hypothetical protein
MTLFAATVFAAPRYRLVKGKGFTVCEAFLKNLNAFPPAEPPMVCEQKIHPSHPEFRTPKWEELNIEDNLTLVHAAESQLLEFTPTGQKPSAFGEWAKGFHERVALGKVKPRLRKLVVALNNKGPEVLISYDPDANECQQNLALRATEGGGGYVFVLRPNSEMLLEQFAGLIGNQERLDVILYRHTPYFVNARDDLLRDGKTWVWSIGLHPPWPASPANPPDQPYGIRERCEFQYVRDDKPVGVK